MRKHNCFNISKAVKPPKMQFMIHIFIQYIQLACFEIQWFETQHYHFFNKQKKYNKNFPFYQ